MKIREATMLTGNQGDGNTPLSPEEQNDLIPDLTTREELNEWERQNILEAYAWAFDLRSLRRQDPLTEAYLRELHRRMFDQTWKWAGLYRSSEKNLGIAHYLIRDTLAALLGDARYWLQHKTFKPDETAIRFHHRLVWIHPFPNGNGRHARIMADVLVQAQGSEAFTWGGGDMIQPGNFRSRYIHALRAADHGDIEPILKFARS